MSSERRVTPRHGTCVTAVLLAAAGLAVVDARRSRSISRSRGVTDPGVVTTRQAITPAGVQSVFDGRVYGITFGAIGERALGADRPHPRRQGAVVSASTG